ncbi:hypothetical protein LA080_001306 [Diaporthe eres]|nr:hypothetical protein LA080_001306 [Diaporthe eres]
MCLEELPGVGSVTEKLEQALITRLNAEGDYGDAKPAQPRKKALLEVKAKWSPNYHRLEQHMPMYPPLS